MVPAVRLASRRSAPAALLAEVPLRAERAEKLDQLAVGGGRADVGPLAADGGAAQFRDELEVDEHLRRAHLGWVHAKCGVPVDHADPLTRELPQHRAKFGQARRAHPRLAG